MSGSDPIIVPGGAAAPVQPQPMSAAVTTHDGKVILHFSEPREYVAMGGLEPAHIGAKLLANAVVADESTGQPVLDLCMAIMDSVFEARGDLKPAGGAVKHELIERHRKVLIRRLEVVLNTRREKKKVSNGQLAKELVDIALHEVFA